LPVDRYASESSNKDSDTRQNNRPDFKAGKWFAFPVFLICAGGFGVFFGIYFTYVHRNDGRFIFGLGSFVIGISIFVHGVSLIMAGPTR
jgi:hypothetical protein